ncbi:DUF6541 family protein [Naasia aerilata]|uniref:DUF2029 domain-containing protein n=1 Tax=Naasia aerilata TaxID=1162966 RepID=A0ABN6XQM9_9MICO|nr:DUF6541 family protein [Naasia aerilata]BDZ45900.1 hypothetical protein GCM10025866_18090 [Naasia aerilata]
MIAALAGAVLIVVLPGAVAAYALGLRGLHLLGLAGPLSVALTAGIAVLLAPLGIPFLWWQPLAAAVLVLVVRVAIRRRLPALPLSGWGLAVLAAIAASGAVAGLIAFGGVPLGAVNSTYDGIFHLNAVAYILSTGDGSSFDLYRMTHPGTDLEFYPAAWHDLVAATVQLTGAPIPLATNATWIAVTGGVWIPGVVYLAATAFGDRARVLVALLAAPLATVFAAAPYLLLDWGTLFPTGLAYALLPSGLALLVLVLRVVPQPDAARLGPLVLIACAALWTLAAGMSHPRSLFGLVVLGLPLVLLWGRASWPASGRTPRAGGVC